MRITSTQEQTWGDENLQWLPYSTTTAASAGEENLLADPDRLLALAEKHGTQILGDYPVPGHS